MGHVETDLYAPPAGYAVPDHWQLGDDADYLAEQTWQLALRGENDVEAYLESFAEELEGAAVSDDQAHSWFTSVINARRDQQARWGVPVPTTSLDAAFTELAEHGVIARADFTCCGTCGSAEIFDERDDSRVWRGYIFFHTQDTDAIFTERTTYLNYGIFLPAYFEQAEWEAKSDAEAEEAYRVTTLSLMNDEVIPLLRRHGITVDWDGDLATRIRLSDVDFVVPMPEAI